MSLESMQEFGEYLATQHPRARKALLHSFHTRLVRGAISRESRAAIEAAARIEQMHGFTSHAAVLLNHPAYLQQVPVHEQTPVQRFRYSLHRKVVDAGISDITIANNVYDLLYAVTDGDVRIADQYLGAAILDVKQNRKKQVRVAEIAAVDPVEWIALQTTGRDVWDQVRYATQVPLLPEGVGLQRVLKQWDANRELEAKVSARHGQLPQYALTELIQTSADEYGAVTIPFRYEPAREEVEAVARHFASFVSAHRPDLRLQLEDLSDCTRHFDDYQFRLVQPAGPDVPSTVAKYMSTEHYRVRAGFAFERGAQGAVVVRNSQAARTGERDATLDAYVASFTPQ